MALSTCIPDNILRALAAGELIDEQAACWEVHLLECAEWVGIGNLQRASPSIAEDG